MVPTRFGNIGTLNPAVPTDPTKSPAFLNDARTVYNDLNSGNYTGAWNTALATSPMFHTNMGTATTDPLLQALETSQGLQAFDPSKKWDPASLNAYYKAFDSTGAYHGNNAGNEYLGKNPYGLWGNASDIASGKDQSLNISQEGLTPDVARFAGARPTKSFLGKYGADLAMLGLAVAAPYAIGALAPALGGAAVGDTAALADAVAGSTLGAAPEVIGASALYGAGAGAIGGALTGGNIGKDALLGGLGGGLTAGISTGVQALGGSNFLGNTIGKIGSNLTTGAVNNAMSNTMPVHSAGTGFIDAGLGGAHGNMGSTDTSLAGAISGALPGVLQGATGIYGSQNAAEAQQKADANAIATQQSTLGNINSIWAPQRSVGTGADAALTSSLGLGGKPADPTNFLNMPGYKFAVQQGTQAIQRQAAAMGNAYTPNTAEAVGQYVTGTAMQDYNTYINQLMGAAGLGSTANAGVATPTYQTGANISQLQVNQGQAQASGVLGSANSVGGIFGPSGAGTGLIGAASNYLFGNRGGAGGGGGGGVNWGGGGGGGSYSGPGMDTGFGQTPNIDTGLTDFSSGAGAVTDQFPSIDTGLTSFDTSSIDNTFDPSSFLGGF